MNKYTKRRLLVALLIVLIVGFFVLTIPFWAIHFKAEGNFDSNLVLKALVDGFNNNPKTFLGGLCFACIMLISFGIPAAIGFVIEAIRES